MEMLKEMVRCSEGCGDVSKGEGNDARRWGEV